MRRPDSPPGGNHLASARLTLPAHGSGPTERVRNIRRPVTGIVTSPTLRVVNLIAHRLAYAPTKVIAASIGFLLRGNDLMASNFAGLPVETCLAGAKVTAIHPYLPLLRTPHRNRTPVLKGPATARHHHGHPCHHGTNGIRDVPSRKIRRNTPGCCQTHVADATVPVTLDQRSPSEPVEVAFGTKYRGVWHPLPAIVATTRSPKVQQWISCADSHVSHLA
ncbi:hypothetical protein BS329_20380 [Amycolatopsis coloradensis]|uniref:O-acyltransferase WSD1 C-terminal domain-containing protein n=1 Tax=Amycolatopsis coloradensis TaxID=76021 RepID=A0A1R0KQN0_9PSEU|nr:hypothetical protein BS329_20380 [Amycolatopsis coloradensis]